MVERVVERRKEPEPEELIYEQVYKWFAEKARPWVEGTGKGKVVIKGKDIPFQQSRHGLLKYYSHPAKWCAAGEWLVHVHHLRNFNGNHRHQGGVGLFCWEGKGYSIVDGVRYDWEKDDLLLLPVKPGGCAHQHFNAEPEKGPAIQVVLGFPNLGFPMGGELKQIEESPDWKGPTPSPPHVT